MRKYMLPLCNVCCVAGSTFRNITIISLVKGHCLLQVNHAVTKAKTMTQVQQTEVKSNKRKKHSEEISEYFESKQCLKDVVRLIPEKILVIKRRLPDSLYLVDKEVADRIVNIIEEDLIQGDCTIIEGNPGLGLVTKGLLTAGVKNLQLYESTLNFIPNLHVITEQHNVPVYTTDIFNVNKMTFQDKLDNGGRIESIMKRIRKKEWKDEAAFKIVGVLPSISFFKHIMMSHVLQTGLMVQGRPEMFLVMRPADYHILTCSKDASYRCYRSTSVLFQLIFESKLLAKLPRKAFFPWMVQNSLKKRNIDEFRNEEGETLYLVKINARKDFFEETVPVEQLQPLWYFIRTHMISRHNKVIQQLEQWIPGCGPRLIIKGTTIFTEFGNLTPSEIVALFKQFISWPEYQDCNFISSMESHFMKMELLSDELDSSHSAIDDDSETLDAVDKSSIL